ncbi:MAG: hypothetical protein ABIJ31_06325 [Pseudomonadota bacterium]
MTHILLFLHKDSGKKGEFFLEQIQTKLNGIKIDICRNVTAFKKTLAQRRPFMEKEILLLFLDSQKRLDQLYSKKEMFNDKKIVLVHAKNLENNMSLIHKLYPRYFTAANDKYGDLCDVLNKMSVQ